MSKSPRTRALETTRRSQVVTVRLDPKLKYVAELAARRQRRPLSSFIEWSVEQSLRQVEPDYFPTPSPFGAPPDTFWDVANVLWDVDEPDRFVKLAIRYPDLLDHEEQRLWKLIRENGYLWRGAFNGSNGDWRWSVEENSFIWKNLRSHWDTFCAVARGEEEPSVLPSWVKTKPVPPPSSGGGDRDDEIPF